MVGRFIKDGKVAVLISYYGGWSTWCLDARVKEFFAFSPKLIEAFFNGVTSDEVIDIIKNTRGLRLSKKELVQVGKLWNVCMMKLEWVPLGSEIKIQLGEDRAEFIIINPTEWMKA